MPATDQFEDRVVGLESPAEDFFAITPSDNVELEYRTRAIFVGAGGTITAVRGKYAPVIRYGPGVEDAIRFGAGASDMIKYAAELTCQFTVQAGQILPIRTRRVNATGTTATGLDALI
jgi:hypothetical protein